MSDEFVQLLALSGDRCQGVCHAKNSWTLDGAISIGSYPTEHPITDYIYQNGKFIYSPLPDVLSGTAENK